MSRASALARGFLGAAVLAAVAVAFAPMAFGGFAPPKPSLFKSGSAPGSVYSSALAGAAEHMQTSLREAAEGGGAKQLPVIVMLDGAKAKAPSELVMPLRLKLHADPAHTFYVGRVRADALVKLATGRNVEYVADNGDRQPPIIPTDDALTPADQMVALAPDRAVLQKAAAASALDPSAAQTSSGISGLSGGAQPTGWFDIGPGHSSSAAWNNGFTGTGIKVAVADDGLDFGHPDLQGTQAYNPAGSAYAGWPMALDPFSTMVYAQDAAFGTTLTAQGMTWFSSTTATMSQAATGSFNGVVYTLPATSKSGVYHVGVLRDRTLRNRWFLAYPALLVADENVAGVYDTVYVDLNNNKTFLDDKKLTKADPISSWDFRTQTGALGQDGIADLSGGMVYWISDGTHHPPFVDVEYDTTGWPKPGSGDLVCMIGAFDYFSTHGTMCGSVVAGQGIIDGPGYYASSGYPYPAFKPTNTWTTGGMVQGAGKAAKLVAISDVYNQFQSSVLMAYDFVSLGVDGVPNSGDEVQIMSNSYGDSQTDNDEWDYMSRYVTRLNDGLAPTTSFLFSTGNGGPGYGTNAPPSPATGIGIGASTEMGADGGIWDSISTLQQVTYGDIIPFSNRGPSAAGHMGPAVVADGAYASGDVALSVASGNGWRAWDFWGGTSRSCPVAAGNLALVYQAFKSKNGRLPTYSEARDLLQSGATDLNYDTLTQGSGSVNADRSTRLAAGLSDGGLLVSPSFWAPGSFRGANYPSFAQIVHPGDNTWTTLKVTNPGSSPVSVDVSDAWLQRSQTITMSVTLDPAQESPYTFSRPDWLTNLTSSIPAGTDLMVVRATVPYGEFETAATMTPTFYSDYVSNNRFRMLAYDWTDHNANAALWTDTNANGYVNVGEIDTTEYERFTYSNMIGPTAEIRVQKPLSRSHSGIFLGFQHTQRSGIPVHVNIEVSFWNHRDMPWLAASASSFTLAGNSSRNVPVFLSVPADAPLGTYEGQFRVRSDATTVSVVPVIMSVAGTGTDITYGGPTPYEQLQDTSRVFGYTDWGWRAESGDWRFYTTDVPDTATLSPNALWLAHTTWSDMPNDLDTLLYGPTASSFTPTSTFGPYTLDLKGGSVHTNRTNTGIWTFATSTGGTEDWVAGKLDKGLNEIMIHHVLAASTPQGVPFAGQTGVFALEPAAISLNDTQQAHTVDFEMSSSLDLGGVSFEAFGLSKKWSSSDATVANVGTWTHEFDVAHAAYLEASTVDNDGSDIDLFVDRWDTGTLTWVALASSQGSTGNEYVKLVRPADGHYRTRVYGWAVPAGTTTFYTDVTAPQGTDVVLSGIPVGAISKNTTYPMQASFTKDRVPLDSRDGTFTGVIEGGPTGAGSALSVPITLHYPFALDSSTPASGTSNVATNAIVNVVFTKHVATATLTSTSLVVKSQGTTLTGSIAYQYSMAMAQFIPNSPLSPGATITVTLSPAITAADGDAFGGGRFSFSTVPPIPVTTILKTPASPNGSGGWYKTATVTIARTPSGGFTKHWIDSGAIKATMLGTFSFAASEGIHDYSARSVNSIGVPEAATRTVTIKCDSKEPVTASDAKASYAGTAVVTLSPSDPAPGSGVASTRYSLDGGPAVSAKVITVATSGSHTLRWSSIDVAGNRETTKSAAFAVVMHTAEVSRVSGLDRYEVAANLAAKVFPGWRTQNGAGPLVTTVIVACGSDAKAADPLGAAGLSGAAQAPLLLVRTDTAVLVPKVTIDTLDKIALARGGVKPAIVVVGGPASVTPAQWNVLKAHGSSIARIGGLDRYEVAANVAYEIKRRSGGALPPFVLIAAGNSAARFFEPLALGAVASRNKAPVLLVKGSIVPPATLAAVRSLAPLPTNRYLGADATETNDAARFLLGVPVANRIAGATSGRDVFAVAVADFALAQHWLGTKAVGVTNKIADSLGCGTAMGFFNGPVLYTDPTGNLVAGSPTTVFLKAHKAGIDKVFVIGGPASVTDACMTTIAQIWP